MFQWLTDYLNPKCFGISRSDRWPTVRKQWLIYNSTCSACGTKIKLQVHHIIPFHLDLEKELDPKNLITLCEPHHLLIGHLMSWSSWNINVVKDAALWLAKIQQRPK